MSTKLSEIVLNSFIQSISDEGNSCGFSLPFIFENGSPAVVYAHKTTTDKIILNDHGLNIRFFHESIGIADFNSEDKIKDFISLYDNIFIKNGSLIAESTVDDLDFTMLDYTDVLKKMISFKYKSKEHKAIDEILEKIKKTLELKFSNIIVHPELVGKSGGKYKFNFAHGNTYIDFIEPEKNKTNSLLRKMIDTQTPDSNINFNVIIDDMENDKYKTEQSIISEYAQVQTLSKFLKI